MKSIKDLSVLCLAPHTDDVELGCGGLVAKLVRGGAKVAYVAFSDCQTSVPEGFPKDILQIEAAKATKELGITEQDIHLLDFQVREFQRDRQAILDAIIKLRHVYNPDLVLTPSSIDVHQDHAVVYKETLRAFKSATILGYELPWNNYVSPNSLLIELSEAELNIKIAALSHYDSQKHRRYMTAKYIESLAITRGVQRNALYAEAFEPIRILA